MQTHSFNRLRVFISSTSDLKLERDAVEQALSKLKIDSSRFEAWPSTPNQPMAECLQQIDDSDAMILLLGETYGSLTNDGISVTHLEFRHAKLKMPVFAYILYVPEREPEQVRFIEEVQKTCFNCRPIRSKSEIKQQVIVSFEQEFTRCFRKVHMEPPGKIPHHQSSDTASLLTLPNNLVETCKVLENYYNSNELETILSVSKECKNKFGNSAEILNFIHMTEINLAMDGSSLVKPPRLVKAIEFLESNEAKKRWASYALAYNQGNAFTALKRYRKAIECYKTALKEKSDYAPCWKNLGDAYRDMDKIIDARNCYEKALKYDPQLFEALFSLSTLLIQHENNYEAALQYLNRILLSELQAIPLASVHGWKAIAYLRLGHYSEGVASALEAIKNNPDAEWAWQTTGRLFALAWRRNKHWLSKAVNFWEQFVCKYPHYAEAWAELGFAYWFFRDKEAKEKNSEKALNAFTKAMKLGFEDDGLVLDRIGHLHQEKEKWPEAEKAFRLAAERDSKQFGYCHGVSLVFLKRYGEALPLYLAAAQEHQPDTLSWFQVACCYENLGCFDEAVKAYEITIQLDQNYAKAWFNLGGLYWNKGDIDKARSVWKKAMLKFPEHELSKQARDCLE